VIGDVGGDPSHAARVTGRTHPQRLTGKGYEPLVAAVHTLRASEAVGQDTAPEVGPEAALYVGRWPESQRIGLSGLVEERLQMMLDHGIKWGARWPAWSVNRPGVGPIGYRSETVPVSVPSASMCPGVHGKGSLCLRGVAMAVWGDWSA
jgi:hypothetical protein